jgi:ABC-2 type transport system ATP-binding protein
MTDAGGGHPMNCMAAPLSAESAEPVRVHGGYRIVRVSVSREMYMTVIDVRDLTKVYASSGVVALNGVSLSVEQGEIYALLGPNGAGKTTLFKTLLGISGVTSGSVEINALPPSDPESRRKVGYLPENHRFPGHLTGLGLLRLVDSLYGHVSTDIESRASELLELVNMARWSKMKMKRYSKGMSQRIGLAQAMISDPDILLLDEPTDGIDPVGKIEMRNVLKRIRDQGKTIVLNSHLLSEVESVADRVAILSDGKLLKTGSVHELTSRSSQYEIEADLGDCEISLEPSAVKILARDTNRLTAELNDAKDINGVIDELRKRRIDIMAVRPMRITLEQSFLETITDDEEAGG